MKLRLKTVSPLRRGDAEKNKEVQLNTNVAVAHTTFKCVLKTLRLSVSAVNSVFLKTPRLRVKFLYPIQPLFLLLHQFQRAFDRKLFETHLIARAELAETPEVGRDHVGRFGVSAGGLVLDKQDDRLPVGRHLDGSERHSFGEHVARRAGNRRAAQPQAHAIGFFGDGVFSLVKLAGEPGGLRAVGDAERPGYRELWHSVSPA